FYHTFIERYGLRDEDAAPALRTATALAGEAQRLGLQASLTPHAPYSTSAALYAALLERSRAWSVHNQESREEHQLFAQGSGALHALFARMGLTPPPPTGASSIHHTLRHAHSLQRLLLVHNTTTTAADYEAAAAACRRLWWVLCPSSNLYIHGQLPPVALLRAKGAALAVGTDSLASTGSLNVLDELKLLAHHFPHIPLHETLRWATLGGAEALGMAQTLGSLEKGKRPGVALISGIDFDNMRLTPASCARRL
ncbi:MAG: amidohydrolase family protein, partial [Prevotellaceae bacterium]|nr:amidohydrolase family protein [Prevotellaceae bacterium]